MSGMYRAEVEVCVNRQCRRVRRPALDPNWYRGHTQTTEHLHLSFSRLYANNNSLVLVLRFLPFSTSKHPPPLRLVNSPRNRPIFEQQQPQQCTHPLDRLLPVPVTVSADLFSSKPLITTIEWIARF